MFVNTTRIIEEFDISEFIEIVDKYKSRISVSLHALDHLSDSQRRLFNIDELVVPLLKERPCGVGLQLNGRFAVFYKRNWGFLKIILSIGSRLDIITFINTGNMPNLKRLRENEE